MIPDAVLHCVRVGRKRYCHESSAAECCGNTAAVAVSYAAFLQNKMHGCPHVRNITYTGIHKLCSENPIIGAGNQSLYRLFSFCLHNINLRRFNQTPVRCFSVFSHCLQKYGLTFQKHFRIISQTSLRYTVFIKYQRGFHEQKMFFSIPVSLCGIRTAGTDSPA